MSLLEQAMKEFIIVNKSIIDDGYGGTATVYTDGAKIKGALVVNSSPETVIAQAMGSTNMYTFTVSKDIDLDYHTVIKRAEDNAIFRITNNADEYQTPVSATLNMRQYTAEAWSLA